MRSAGIVPGPAPRTATACFGWLGMRRVLRRLALAIAILCVTAVLLWYGLVLLLVYRAE